MTPTEFCYWLDGFLYDKPQVSANDLVTMRDKLGVVLADKTAVVVRGLQPPPWPTFSGGVKRDEPVVR